MNAITSRMVNLITKGKEKGHTHFEVELSLVELEQLEEISMDGVVLERTTEEIGRGTFVLRYGIPKVELIEPIQIPKEFLMNNK